jgi:2-C-methyl-D-erythritol 2,4-cyclodiphosphate synthase
MAIGLGFDIHRLVAGRRLLLGGLAIDHPRGLLGHSDGDVVLHAITDAILGAMGAGDIGDRFSDTDPRWKDIASEVLLKKVLEDARAGWTVGNVDVTIVAEEPKLGALKQSIARNIARLLGARESTINVKAKTAEGLGAIGNKEAIACLAVCELVPSKVEGLIRK